MKHQEWINALRSGDYEQGNNRLRTLDNKFCCLGVLCTLMPGKWHDDQFVYKEERAAYTLPDTLANELDIPCSGYNYSQEELEGYFDDSVIVSAISDSDMEEGISLAALNDAGATFEQIANLLENKS